MSAQERIMMIRLMEKLQAHPAYAKTLGITVNFENKQKISRKGYNKQ